MTGSSFLDMITDSSPKDAFNYATAFNPMAAGAMAAVMPMALTAANQLTMGSYNALGMPIAGAVAGYYAGSRGEGWWMDAMKGAAGATLASMVLGM